MCVLVVLKKIIVAYVAFLLFITLNYFFDYEKELFNFRSYFGCCTQWSVVGVDIQ